MAEREKIEVTEAHQLSYDVMKDIVARCGGWMRSSSRDGDSAEAWVDDKAYVFSGRGLVEFLYFAKDASNEHVYEALDFLKYVEQSAATPPSVYVRDAMVARAKALRQKWEQGGRDTP